MSLAAALAPALLSSYDRTSLTRLVAAPAPLALLTALGFDAWRRGLGVRPLPSALAACTAIALGGMLLFDVVNPRILRTSWLELALEGTRDLAPDEAAVLTYGGAYDLSWLEVEPIVSQLASQRLRIRRVDAPRALEQARDAQQVLLWSPALEADAGVSSELCAVWPEVRLYTLSDRAALSHAHAAGPAGVTWSLPAQRLQEVDCPGA